MLPAEELMPASSLLHACMASAIQPWAMRDRACRFIGRHVTGELPTSEFGKMLQGLQQQLDTEHQALAGGDEVASAATCSTHSSRSCSGHHRAHHMACRMLCTKQ